MSHGLVRGLAVLCFMYIAFLLFYNMIIFINLSRALSNYIHLAYGL
jgi:hypothetical protein